MTGVRQLNQSYNTYMLNDSIIRVLKKQESEVLPIWIMRQAGRYLPQYKEIRGRAGSFLSLMKTPDLASEVTVQPIDIFNFDAAIIFSDILTIPDSMGLGLQFVESEGPSFKRPLLSPKDLDRLFVPAGNSDYPYLIKAIQITLDKLQDRVPLFGFSGSPITVAKYMFKNKDEMTIWANQYQAEFKKLIDILVASINSYLSAQVHAGVHILQIFDSWGHTLENKAFTRYSVEPLTRIVEYLRQNHPHIPIIIYSRQNDIDLLSQLAVIDGLSALSLDSAINLTEFRQLHPELIIQGNLNPIHVTDTSQALNEATNSVLEQMGDFKKHIFNLGQGITPNARPELVAELVAKIHSIKL